MPHCNASTTDYYDVSLPHVMQLRWNPGVGDSGFTAWEVAGRCFMGESRMPKWGQVDGFVACDCPGAGGADADEMNAGCRPRALLRARLLPHRRLAAAETLDANRVESGLELARVAEHLSPTIEDK